MLVTIYFKRKEGQTEQIKLIYELDLPEFKRLSSDYSSYVHTGKPNKNWYVLDPVRDGSTSKSPQKLLLDFDEIAVIG